MTWYRTEGESEVRVGNDKDLLADVRRRADDSLTEMFDEWLLESHTPSELVRLGCVYGKTILEHMFTKFIMTLAEDGGPIGNLEYRWVKEDRR